jgi:GT2 family glycosyltransferase
VTYNRKQLLMECLESLRKQTRPVQGIYLIDNASTDGTPDLLLEKGYINELPPKSLNEPWEKEFEIKNLTDGSPIRLHYVRMHENTGGAGGFHEGVKRAYEKRYDWLWLMDDDAEPKEDTLEKLLIHDKSDILCMCPLIVNKKSNKVENYHHKDLNFYMLDIPVSTKTNIEDYKDKLFNIKANAFVGPLIRRKAVDLVGFPNPDLFIWGDDTDYTYRIYRKGKIILVGSAIILHKDNPTALNRNQVWKIYYYFRNKIRFIKSYSKYNFLAYIYFFYKAIRQSVSLLIKYKMVDRFLLPIKGIKDGCFENMGKPKGKL